MNLAGMIDHTMLKADAPREVIVRYCEEAKQYHFASVCVNSCRVPLVVQQLQGSGVKVCCVVGFPLGAMLTEAKAAEARFAVEAGAEEVDMVLNVGWLKDKDYDAVCKDIQAVREAAGKDAILKVIIETCLLTEEEKVKACELSVVAGADFVKTSTGFGTGGATAEDVALMKKIVNGQALVKASGGIRTNEDAIRMVEAGADRIGVGNGVPLLKK